MKAWSIDVKFWSPMAYYDPPMLDGIVAYCIEKAQQPWRALYLNRDWEACGRQAVGITKLNELFAFEGDVSICTQMIPSGPVIEFMDSWKKRFELKYRKLINWGKGSRRINYATGNYRYYNTPVAAKAIRQARWLFMGDGPRILGIVENGIIAIGKKTSSGYGWISEISLQPTEIKNTVDILRHRPVPVHLAEELGIRGHRRVTGWKPPYWHVENRALCVVPIQE